MKLFMKIGRINSIFEKIYKHLKKILILKNTQNVGFQPLCLTYSCIPFSMCSYVLHSVQSYIGLIFCSRIVGVWELSNSFPSSIVYAPQQVKGLGITSIKTFSKEFLQLGKESFSIQQSY